MVILDLEYHLSSYIENIKTSNVQYIPQFPLTIPLNEFGDWKPNNQSIFNLFINYPNYGYNSCIHTFQKISTAGDVYRLFTNTFIRDRICNMLAHEDVYMSNINGSDNILELSDNDIAFLNEFLTNPNTNVLEYATDNPILYSFMFSVLSTQKTTTIEPIMPDNANNYIADIIYFVSMNNQFMLSLSNNIKSIV